MKPHAARARVLTALRFLDEKTLADLLLLVLALGDAPPKVAPSPATAAGRKLLLAHAIRAAIRGDAVAADLDVRSMAASL